MSALGPLLSGALLEHHTWGSVFLITVPFAAVAAVMAVMLVPAHVNETTDPVDNPGGILSIVAIAAIVLAINFAPVPNKGTVALGAGCARATCAGSLLFSPEAHQVPFVRPACRCPSYLLGGGAGRYRRIRQPDGRDIRGPAVPSERARLLDARRWRLDSAGGLLMVVVAPHSAKLVDTRGSRFTLLIGYTSVCSGSSRC